MAHYTNAFRRTLARALSSSQTHLFTHSLSRPTSSHALPTRNPRPGSTRIHFRLLSTDPGTAPEEPEPKKPDEVDENENNEDDDEESLIPPKWVNPENVDEAVMIDGCDFEHWLVIMGFSEEQKLSDRDMVQSYVSTVAKVVGSEEVAKKKIYSVSTGLYTGFGVALSREVAETIRGLPNVDWVLPDSYMDVPSKDYGGDLYIDGEIVSRPEYQVPVRQERKYSHSDDEDYEKLPLNDFEYDTNDKVYEQLKATIQASKEGTAVVGPTTGVPEDLSRQATSNLFRKLKEKLNTLSKTVGSEGPPPTELKTEVGGGVKRSKIEPYKAKVEEDQNMSDLNQDFVANKRDLDKPLTVFSRIQSKSLNESDIDELREGLSHIRKETKNTSGLSNPNSEPTLYNGIKSQHLIFDKLRETPQEKKNEHRPSGSGDEEADLEKFEGEPVTSLDQGEERLKLDRVQSMSVDELREGLSQLKRETKPNSDPTLYRGSKSRNLIFDRLRETMEQKKKEKIQSGIGDKVLGLEKFDKALNEIDVSKKRPPIERYSFGDELADVAQPKPVDTQDDPK